MYFSVLFIKFLKVDLYKNLNKYNFCVQYNIEKPPADDDEDEDDDDDFSFGPKKAAEEEDAISSKRTKLHY